MSPSGHRIGDETADIVILDVRYEKVREGGIISSQAVLIAVAVDGEGRRQVLAVELANRESRSCRRDFLSGPKQRGLFGVEFVVSDDHERAKLPLKMVYRGGRGSHLDDERASRFSNDSGLRSGDLDLEKGAMRWSISLV